MIRTFALMSATALSVAACATAEPELPGALFFSEQCAVCHGAKGRGDGLLASDLSVAPADLTLLARNNGGVYPIDDVMAQVYGYPGRYQIGGMPEFGPLLDGPVEDWVTQSGETLATPRALIDLAIYLEGLQR
ncbi:c-type cytochrome [Tateyamaria sp.]|uniref:c-type cytochrome n=1 Tax=Tateyamaria sp. TaxID=1929288 RepID=UPI003B224F6F